MKEVLAIGNFDGVHLGHKVLMDTLRQTAERLKVNPLVITFDPLPKAFFSNHQVAAILPLRDRIRALKAYGIETIHVLHFNATLANLSPVTFLEKIRACFQPSGFVLGHDFHFGKNRVGDATFIQNYFGQTAEVIIVPEYGIEDKRVSSSQVRAALLSHQYNKVKTLLGGPIILGGKVAHGDKIGRTLGYPTANINLRTPLSVAGVWAATVEFADRSNRYLAAVNIGTRPTIAGKKWRLEAHLLDFNEDIYGQLIKVTLQEFIRPERAFIGLETLKTAIAQDIEQVRTVCKQMTINTL